MRENINWVKCPLVIYTEPWVYNIWHIDHSFYSEIKIKKLYISIFSCSSQWWKVEENKNKNYHSLRKKKFCCRLTWEWSQNKYLINYRITGFIRFSRSRTNEYLIRKHLVKIDSVINLTFFRPSARFYPLAFLLFCKSLGEFHRHTPVKQEIKYLSLCILRRHLVFCSGLQISLSSYASSVVKCSKQLRSYPILPNCPLVYNWGYTKDSLYGDLAPLCNLYPLDPDKKADFKMQENTFGLYRIFFATLIPLI